MGRLAWFPMALGACAARVPGEPRARPAAKLAAIAAPVSTAPRPARRTIFLRRDAPPPVRVAGDNPEYPSEVRAAAIEGQVVVLFTIAETGLVERVRLIRDVPRLGELVLRAVSRWRFRPYLVEGQPVRVVAQQPFVFKLRD